MYQTELFNRTTRQSFHNTIVLKGEALQKRELRTDSQNAQILDFFKRNPDQSFTPSEIYEHFNKKWPITSIRRGMTDLTVQDYLVKTKERRAGMFGDLNFAWTLKR